MDITDKARQLQLISSRIGSCILPIALLLLLLFCGKFVSGDVDEIVGRHEFPDGFLFGVSTSAYQVEGGILEDGKGLSNWDVFAHIKGTIENGETGDVADDHYHRYLEDIEIIHSLGVDSYRFSISWSRILPRGKFGDVNPAGIAFYNKLINLLLLKGIQPFVTIHHHDVPQELEDRYGGWLSPLMQEDFLHFAETCFKNFGDRVKYWITINEPTIHSEMGYMRGTYSPGRCSPPFGNCSAGNSDTEPLIVVHNMLLGHAKTVKLYRHQFQLEQGGSIGINISGFMYEPLMDDDEHDKEAANRALAFYVAWSCNPVVFGDYPPEMRRYHGKELPEFTPEETKLVKNSIDFIGITHYTSLYAEDCLHSTCDSDCTNLVACTPGSDRAIKGFVKIMGQKDGILIGEPTGMKNFFVVPRGMERIVDYITNRYHNKPMYITENGYASQEQKEPDLQHDRKRVEYHKAYLAFLARAIRNGSDVRGYFVWALMDNFEWSHGYRVKFGLYSIDHVTLNRSPRLSATWFRDFLMNNNLNVSEKRSVMLLRNADELLMDVKDERIEI